VLPSPILPGTLVLAEVDEPDGLAEGLAPLDSRATTLVSVPLRVVTVMPAVGSASLLPSAGVTIMSAAASEARGVGVADLLTALLLVLWGPLRLLEQAVSSRDNAATTMPATRPSRDRSRPEWALGLLVLRRTVLLHWSDWPWSD
jgi:hypothetical protein